MRHADADYTGPAERNTSGWGFDLAPLSDKGVDQTKKSIHQIKKISPEIVICSSTARALETTMHIISEFNLPFKVEFDIHEWVPDLNFQWKGIEDVLRIERDFNSKDGLHTPSEAENWESFPMMRERMNNALDKYNKYSKILVVCHSMVIRSLTGKKEIGNTEIIEYVRK